MTDGYPWTRAPATGSREDLALRLDALLKRLVNIEAEQAVLGAMLANPKAYEMVVGQLRAEHFADPLHQSLYDLYEDAYRRGLTPDGVTLRHEVVARERARGADDENAEEAGRYLATLLSAMVSILSAPSYAKVVIELWQRRQAAVAGCEMIEQAGSEQPIGDALRDGASKLDDIRKTDARGEPVSMGTAIRKAVNLANTAAQRGGVLGYRTGFERFDRMIGGLRPGRLYYGGGRPGMGKSVFLQSIARGLVQGLMRGDPGGTGVVLFSAEMDDAFLGEREIASSLDIDSDDIGAGRLTPAQWMEADALARDIDRAPLFIIDQPGPTPEEMVLAVRRLKRKHKIGVVGVDHVHICRPPRGRYGGRQEQLEAISMGLKALAKETETAVVALAQLSRGVEEREDKRPVLADLRASGGLEQDADGVFFLYRESYYLEKDKPHVPPDASSDDKRYREQLVWQQRMIHAQDRAELIVAKNRGGRLGTIDLAWNGSRARYGEWEGQQE